MLVVPRGGSGEFPEPPRRVTEKWSDAEDADGDLERAVGGRALLVAVVVQERELALGRVEQRVLQRLVSRAGGGDGAVLHDHVEDLVLDALHVVGARELPGVVVDTCRLDVPVEPGDGGLGVGLGAAGLVEGLLDDLLDGDVVERLEDVDVLLFRRCDQGGYLGCVECHNEHLPLWSTSRMRSTYGK